MDYADASPLVRLDFSDDARWLAVVEAAGQTSAEGFRAGIHPIEERAFDGATPQPVMATFGHPAPHLFIFADRRTMQEAAMTVLCVDRDYPDAGVRCIPSQLWAIENNIRLSNMEMRTFAEAAGSDGVFMGFAR